MSHKADYQCKLWGTRNDLCVACQDLVAYLGNERVGIEKHHKWEQKGIMVSLDVITQQRMTALGGRPLSDRW
jgi:hypothetical protein